MANYKIEKVEGVDDELSAKFREVGIDTTDKLLAGTRTKKQRKELAESVGVSEKSLLRLANLVDLFRIKGIGQKFSDLLEIAGVDTVPELAVRKAENLTAKMEEVNAEKNLTGRTPALKEVEKWIKEAKSLPRMLEY